MAEEVNVALADGRTVLAQPILGGWMGGTRERPYPDFAELPGREPMANTGIYGQEERISRDAYFAAVVGLTAKRSSCRRAGVGAIAVQDRRIVATGYNGPPPDVDCSAGEAGAGGCDRGELEGCQRAIHAEANLVAWAARAGVQLQGATVWSTHSPCRACAQLLLAAGIEQFVYLEPYRLGRPDLLAEGGVETFVWVSHYIETWHPITHKF